MALIDSRLVRLAQVLVHYSLHVQPGNLVAIHGGIEALPLLREVYREVLRAGGYPQFNLEVEEAREIYLKEASDEQLDFVSPVTQLINERYDCLLYIDAESNTHRLSRVDPARAARRRKAHDAVDTAWSQRAAQGLMRWCYTQYPTQAYAQDAHMSLEDYCEFVFNAGMLNDSDPVACWREMAARQQTLVAWLKGRRQAHILGEDTDRGSIRFTLPSSYEGRAVDDVRLHFEDGRVVEAHAGTGEDYLLSMLDIDAGARRIGEFAFGMNYGIREATRNILYDEKIGGTIHLALGRSYPESGGLNISALHWDMICDLRQQGEVWIDGELFLQNGRYILLG